MEIALVADHNNSGPSYPIMYYRLRQQHDTQGPLDINFGVLILLHWFLAIAVLTFLRLAFLLKSRNQSASNESNHLIKSTVLLLEVAISLPVGIAAYFVQDYEHVFLLLSSLANVAFPAFCILFHDDCYRYVIRRINQWAHY